MANQSLKMSRLWLMLAALLVGTLIGTMGNSIVSIAVPSLMDYYAIPLSSATWSITLYTLTFSVLIPVFGSLARAIGFKKLFVSGMILVIASSILCIYANNFAVFLLARISIGIGVATILPTIMGIISHYFPAQIQGKATGYWALVNSLGHAIGPVIGGFLLNRFAWQSIFWINLPLAAASILLALQAFPKDERIPGGAFDWQGAAAMTIFVFSGMMAISLAAQENAQPVQTALLAAAAAVGLAFFLWRERRVARPFVDLGMFRKKEYIAAIIPISLQAFTQFGLLVALPVFLIDVHTVEKQLAGFIIMFMTVMMAVTSPFAGRLVDRMASRWVCLAGCSLIGLAAVLMLSTSAQSLTAWGWVLFAICLSVFGAGFGSIQSSATVAALQSAPKETAGAATGFFHMIRFVSASLGSTVFGILLEVNRSGVVAGFYTTFWMILAVSLLTLPFTFWLPSRLDPAPAFSRNFSK